MTTVPNSTPPDWMLRSPEPRLESRKFRGKEFMGWAGSVPLKALQGWVDNPRIDIPVERFREENFSRDPSDEELLELMLDISVNDGSGDEESDDEADIKRGRKNKLLELAESIRLNGVRVPLIVTADKRILDGNRRYYASLYLSRFSSDDDIKDAYAYLPAWVLPSGVSDEDEDRILTELNSINDCYVKWPYSVRARRVYRDFKDGLSIEEIARKYHDWTKSRIDNVIEASKVAEEFTEYHDDSIEAKDLAYRKLIWFDELRRSNSRHMRDSQFRNGVFELILSPGTPFSSHKDFQRLGEVYDNNDAWETLNSKVGKAALKDALFIVDRDKYEERAGAQAQLKRVNELLNRLITQTGFGNVEPDTLAEFHALTRDVPGQRSVSGDLGDVLVDILDDLTSKEIAELPEMTLSQLRRALERVITQASSYRGESA